MAGLTTADDLVGGGRLSSRHSKREAPAPSWLERRHLHVSVSRIAEVESWRKEIYRPATYVHKWWARRLGSVFRAVMLASVNMNEGANASEALANKIVYDPFAGSGTTLVEALKLGARVAGRDINPVATLTQRQAIAQWRWHRMESLHRQVRESVASKIESYYVSSDGRRVLFYFWVSMTSCPTCEEEVALFSSYVFARHAYLTINPIGQAICPSCHAICPLDLSKDKIGHCASCDKDFDLAGPVRGKHMLCSNGHKSEILKQLDGATPARRMYAKLVIDEKMRSYLPIDEFDLELYDRAAKALADAPSGSLIFPEGELEAGVNTVQALRWGYTSWKSFYNDRQLLTLGSLAQALKDLPPCPEREALMAAFSKTVEHNNLFCSYKGEGTGPVRSLFHNHALRPERVSVEGNPWGEKAGSGGFGDALWRLLRAHEYKQSPSDLVVKDGDVVSVSGHSCALERDIVTDWDTFKISPTTAYVVTGDAASTDLPAKSVDLIVTDPPYVDNVHYSELADFFHAWTRPMRPFSAYDRQPTTRNESEVQNTEAEGFRCMITRVFEECRRVLKDQGMMIFSFHQSTTEGWSALMRALQDARFEVTAIRPVVAEVTTSLAKVGAREPNRIDVFVVARKREDFTSNRINSHNSAKQVMKAIHAMQAAGLKVGIGDARTAVRAAILAQGTRVEGPAWEQLEAAADEHAELAAQAFRAPTSA